MVTRAEAGILCVHKPSGSTSHDVVDFVRRLTGERRVGHCGTLDPLATGVLPILVGRATRLAELLGDEDKEYRVESSLAFTTATGDLAGDRTATYEGPAPPGSAVSEALASFIGPIMQRPHRYSAVHLGGRRLYELARRGEQPEIPARPVTVVSLELESYRFPILRFRLACSRGTYVRSLVEDLGAVLGTGGCVTGLERVRVGSLGPDLARAPFELARATLEGALSRMYVPWTRAFPGARVLQDPPGPLARAIRNGAPFTAGEAALEDLAPETLLLVLDEGRLMAVYRQEPAPDDPLRAVRVLG